MGTAALAVGGLILLWYLAKSGTLGASASMLAQSATATVKPCASVPQQNAPFQAGGPQNLSNFNGGAFGVQLGAQVGTAIASSIGVSLPGIGSIVGLISGIFTAHAQKIKVAQETLLPLAQSVSGAIVAIVNSYNSGQIDAPTAIQALSSVPQQYYNAAASVIKKGGPCTPHTQMAASPCDSACLIGCTVEDWCNDLIAMIQSGVGGTVPMAGWAPGTDFPQTFPKWQLTVRCS